MATIVAAALLDVVVAAVSVAVPLAVCARVAMAAAEPTDLLRTLFSGSTETSFQRIFLIFEAGVMEQ